MGTAQRSRSRLKKPSSLQQRRMDTILREAQRYFVETGIANSKMEDIAERVGVSRQTLYRYYRRKEDLAIAVEMQVLDQILSSFTSLFPPDASFPLKDLEQIIEDSALSFLKEQENRIRYTAIFDSYFHQYGESWYIEAIRNILGKYPNPFRKIIEQEQKAGRVCRTLDPVKAGEVITHSILSLSQRVLIRKEALEAEYGFDAYELIPMQMKLFVRGILCSNPEDVQ